MGKITYEVSSIKSLFSMLRSYVKSNHKGNVDQDGEYRGFCDVKKAKVKVLKLGRITGHFMQLISRLQKMTCFIAPGAFHDRSTKK